MNTQATTVVGIDVAKNALLAYWVVPESGEIRNLQVNGRSVEALRWPPSFV